MEPVAPAGPEPSTAPNAGTFRQSEPSTMEGAGTFQSGVTIDQAAVILGASPSTVRRWVKEGKLHSKRVTTPQGHAFRVYLDGQVPRSEPAGGGRSPGEPAPVMEGAAPPSTPPVAAPSMERAEAMTRYNEALIAPLVAELAEARSALLAQADRIAELARENGVLTERLAGLERVRDAAIAHAHELEQKLEAAARPREPAPDPFPASIPPTPNVAPWWRRWFPWLASAGLVLLVGSVSCQAPAQAGGVKSPALCQAAREVLDERGPEAMRNQTASVKDVAETLNQVAQLAERVC